MAKKSEFSDVVKDLERKFQEIDQQKKRLNERIQKLNEILPSEDHIKKTRQQENAEQRKFRIQEKLTTGLVVFCIGQMMLLTVCFRNPEYFLKIWVLGTVSLLIICIAVMDYS